MDEGGAYGRSGGNASPRKGRKCVNGRKEEERACSICGAVLSDLLVIILIIAAVISMVSGNAESTVVILAVIVMNAVLGTVQHEKAEKSLKQLKVPYPHPEAKVI